MPKANKIWTRVGLDNCRQKKEQMRDFRKLQVWEKSHALVLSIYQSTQSFPKDELFGLTNQMRRASISIPANIAEGAGRESLPERIHFI